MRSTLTPQRELLKPALLPGVELERLCTFPAETEAILSDLAWLFGQQPKAKPLLNWLKGNTRLLRNTHCTRLANKGWQRFAVVCKGPWRGAFWARVPCPPVAAPQGHTFCELAERLLARLSLPEIDIQQPSAQNPLLKMLIPLLFTPVRSFFWGKWFEYYLERVIRQTLEQSDWLEQFWGMRNVLIPRHAAGGPMEVDFLLLLPQRTVFFEAKSNRGRKSLDPYVDRIRQTKLPRPEFVLVTARKPKLVILGERTSPGIPVWQLGVNQLRKELLAGLTPKRGQFAKPLSAKRGAKDRTDASSAHQGPRSGNPRQQELRQEQSRFDFSAPCPFPEGGPPQPMKPSSRLAQLSHLIPRFRGRIKVRQNFPAEVEQTLSELAWLLGERRQKYQGLIHWFRHDARVVRRKRVKELADWNQLQVKDAHSSRVFCARKPFPKLEQAAAEKLRNLALQLLLQLAPQRCDRTGSLQQLCQQLMFTPAACSFLSGMWFEYYVEQVVVRFLEQSNLQDQFIAERNVLICGGPRNTIEIDYLLFLRQRSFYFEAKSGENQRSLKLYVNRVKMLDLPSPELVLITAKERGGNPIRRVRQGVVTWRVDVNQLRQHILAPLVHAS